MRKYLDDEDFADAEARRLWFIDFEAVVRAALEVYQRYMDDAAKDARAAYEAGASNGLITNNGYLQSAQMFEQSSAKARKAYNAMVDIRYPNYDDGEDE